MCKRYLVNVSETRNDVLETRNDVDAQHNYAILKAKPYYYATNMLKAYLITQPFSFGAFMLTYTCPQALQKTAKHKSVCGD